MLLVSGVAMALEIFLLNAASRYGDFSQQGRALVFVPLMLLAGAALLAAVGGFRRVPRPHQPLALWAFAVALRMAMILCPPGDDFWRYVWEGRVQHAGHNPFVHNPRSPELQYLRDEHWKRINHPESPAIYPPAAQLVFAALAGVSTAPFCFKLCFLTADLLTLGLLLRLIGGELRYQRAAWYAWNPAVVYAFTGAAHYDSLMILALTAATCALERATRLDASKPPCGWATTSSICLGLAIALKVIPILLLPVWMFALRSRAWLLSLSVAIPLALTVPFGGLRVVIKPLISFADVTRFHELLVWIFPNPWQRNWPVTVLLAVSIAFIALRFQDDWRRSALWVLGAVLILSPVLHPWYATWILPLAVWRQQSAWTLLSISALGALLLWETTPYWTAWQPNWITRSIVIAPPLLGLAIPLAAQHLKLPRSGGRSV
ncbi:MAG: hypothetical protein M3463_04510 [Verrucomicrobiota bacterium]|nr:hypothetical protein [Verrucomicrobiota bacterium]